MTTTPCFIIPPHLLQRLAQDDDRRVAECAQHTLALRPEVAARRSVKAAHSGPDREARGNTGIIPPDLRSRARTAITTTPDADQNDAAAVDVAPKRAIHDAGNSTALPGELVRAEGDPAVEDSDANEAYEGLGHTFDLFADIYGRNSLDDRGLALVATVHYDRNYANAIWDGEQMIFGDGDGVLLASMTDSVDIIAHELAHGITQYTAGLTYVAQPGALNESVSDVFGSLVKQRILGQTAEQADWIIGANLYAEGINGVGLRSMKAPGTAYDDPRIGKDPQPASMTDYQDLPHDEEHDNGGVHINSGIPNRAFYLAATAIGGHAWERAGQIWYDVLTSRTLPKDSDFATFARATITAAGDRFGQGSTEQQAVEQGWAGVQVL
ncbi:M4 family metallopeptidase [Demetria terragena]|uniref:M4 family metallopeptidase n=1 Tax=Demetria terragena TaxID=63959 RepID=UPI0003648D04|nr:M4 family metallopeptidase [Demetria terragena]